MSKAAELANLIGNINAGGGGVNRNLLINGAFQIFQRQSSATTVTDDNYVTADRVHFWEGTDGAYTSEQSTDAPDGFGYSMKLAVTTADTSLAAGQYAQFEMQKIEGQNLQSLAYGTNAAKDITLSFWVKSNKTGTYTVTFRKTDNTRYQNVQEYTINSANTWEKKIITVSPDSNIKASGGAIGNDTGEGLTLFFNLALGSQYNGATADTWSTNANHYGTTNQVNWMDSTSNELYITGVQLEVGQNATTFEHEPFERTLAKCQRYFEKSNEMVTSPQGSNASGPYIGIVSDNSGNACWSIEYKVRKRADPTQTWYADNGTEGEWAYSKSGASTGYNTVNNHRQNEHATNSYMGVGGNNITVIVYGNWKADAEL